MRGLTACDDAEWEDIRKSFVNQGDSHGNRIAAIQRLAKECAVSMDDAEEITDRWARECGREAQGDREKFTIGDVPGRHSGREK
jgi:hypothetical protein